MGEPEVPLLCRETSVSQRANVGTWLRKRNGGQKWVNSRGTSDLTSHVRLSRASVLYIPYIAHTQVARHVHLKIRDYHGLITKYQEI